jgi:hypothetical protein
VPVGPVRSWRHGDLFGAVRHGLHEAGRECCDDADVAMESRPFVEGFAEEGLQSGDDDADVADGEPADVEDRRWGRT